jgi:hypothetical protein
METYKSIKKQDSLLSYMYSMLLSSLFLPRNRTVITCHDVFGYSWSYGLKTLVRQVGTGEFCRDGFCILLQAPKIAFVSNLQKSISEIKTIK